MGPSRPEAGAEKDADDGEVEDAETARERGKSTLTLLLLSMREFTGDHRAWLGLFDQEENLAAVGLSFPGFPFRSIPFISTCGKHVKSLSLQFGLTRTANRVAMTPRSSRSTGISNSCSSLPQRLYCHWPTGTQAELSACFGSRNLSGWEDSDLVDMMFGYSCVIASRMVLRFSASGTSIQSSSCLGMKSLQGTAFQCQICTHSASGVIGPLVDKASWSCPRSVVAQ